MSLKRFAEVPALVDKLEAVRRGEAVELGEQARARLMIATVRHPSPCLTPGLTQKLSRSSRSWGNLCLSG